MSLDRLQLPWLTECSSSDCHYILDLLSVLWCTQHVALSPVLSLNGLCTISFIEVKKQTLFLIVII